MLLIVSIYIPLQIVNHKEKGGTIIDGEYLRYLKGWLKGVYDTRGGLRLFRAFQDV